VPEQRVPRRPERISAATARRIALAAQGFGIPRPPNPGRRHLLALADRLGLFQIDSVNVLARAHYLPAFSRLGPYDTNHLDAAAWTKRRRALFEYWARQASLLPLALYPLLHWRMLRARTGEGRHKYLARFAAERRGYVAEVLREIRNRGPLAASELSGSGAMHGKWWAWSDAKVAVEYLFWAGEVTVSHRRRAFERVYDLTERVLPPEVLSAPHPNAADAQRALLGIAAAALGIATDTELRGYFQLSIADARPRIDELVDAGELLPVKVDGWKQPTFLHARARIPRRIHAQALLSPFDPLLYDRGRAERIFGFRYRIGLYTPRDQRSHGYYVLPLLLGERIVAQLDLKADRANRVLRVVAAHAEAGADRAEAATAARTELDAVARWQSLAEVEISVRGSFADSLKRA
jgi:uncharacterized protein YcaQ